MSGKVTAELVKQLRERSGVSMSKCKEALDKAEGDIDKAIEWLRKTGVASAVKKEGRETNEGLIGAGEGSKSVALVEINAETDFVTQNEKFKHFLRDTAQQAADSSETMLDALMQQPYVKDGSVTLEQQRALLIQSLGENIQVRRLLIIPKSQDVSVGIYSHMGGKIVLIRTDTGKVTPEHDVTVPETVEWRTKP